MARNLLTDRAIRNAKREAKDYRLADGEGLFLFVAKTGGKSYQFRYKLNGKGQTATLKGIASLAEARVEADRLRKMIAAGDDPRVVKRIARVVKLAANSQTFKATADAWAQSEARRMKWSADYVVDVEQSLVNHLSDLDPLPVSKIVASITAPILHAVEINAPGMAERVSRRLYAIMDYAVEIGAIVANPLPRRRSSKKKGADRRHFAAVTDLPGLGAILRAVAAIDPGESARRAHLLLVFTAMRVSEVVNAKWDEFDVKAGTWSIPRERMKRKDLDRGPHVVPLPPRLLAAMQEWRRADSAKSVYVCPTVRNPEKPMLPEGIAKVYRDALGLTRKHSPHSWRSAFSTVCREAGKDGDVVEAQLDHVVGTKVASAYDRAKRLELRRELMAWYEATLIAARDGAAVVPIKKRKS